MSNRRIHHQPEQSSLAGSRHEDNQTAATKLCELLTAVGIDQQAVQTVAGFIIALYPRSPKLAKLAGWIVPLLIWFVRHFPKYRPQIKRWLLSRIMSRVRIDSQNHRLRVALSNWMAMQPTTQRYLSRAQSLKLWVATNSLVTEQRALVARESVDQDTTASPSGEQPGELVFELEHKSWTVFIGPDGRIFAHTTGAEGDDSTSEVWTFGWSPQPIIKLLTDVNEWDKSQRRVQVYSSVNGFNWSLQSTSPPRSLESISLNASVKKMLFDDIRQFLEPARKKWYEDKGVPYRRGYMFYGEPGCGKTSLARAIAGYFQLNVYCIPLLHPELSNEGLIELFQNVGHKALILFEDIDSAGIGRERLQPVQASEDAEGSQSDLSDNRGDEAGEWDEDARSDHSDSEDGPSDEDLQGGWTDWSTMHSLYASSRGRGGRAGGFSTRSAYAANRGDKTHVHANRTGKSKKGVKEQPKTNVTLSGLLNALDGISSSTGYIMIMTTTHPENLDKALKREGRVDVKVKLTKASKQQAYQMFCHMFRPVDGTPATYNVSQIPSQAKAFAAQIPSGEMSPA